MTTPFWILNAANKQKLTFAVNDIDHANQLINEVMKDAQVAAKAMPHGNALVLLEEFLNTLGAAARNAGDHADYIKTAVDDYTQETSETKPLDWK